MSEFKSSCPHCDQHIAYDESYFGTRIVCPNCARSMHILAPTTPAGREPARLGQSKTNGYAGIKTSRTGPVPTTRFEPPRPLPLQTTPDPPESANKSWLVTFLFALFLGNLGVDRFYAGRIGLGVGKLLTMGFCGLWSVIDVFLLLTRRYQAANSTYLTPASKSQQLIALTILAVVLLANALMVRNVITAIDDAKSRFAGMTSEARGGSTGLSGSEPLGTFVQSGVVWNGRGASSPEEAFAAFQQASQANNFITAFRHVTPASQTHLIEMLLASVALQKAFTKARTTPLTTSSPEVAAALRQAKAREMRIDAILKKHGISSSADWVSRNAIARIKNKAYCYQELMAALPPDSRRDADDATTAKLTEVTINKDSAIARLDAQTVKFKRLNGAWLVDFAN